MDKYAFPSSILEAWTSLSFSVKRIVIGLPQFKEIRKKWEVTWWWQKIHSFSTLIKVAEGKTNERHSSEWND